MNKPAWVRHLEKRWKVSTVQVFIILVAFACTGFTVMFLKTPLLNMLGAQNKWWTSLLYYLLIFPVYNLILLAYGFLLGQFHFFWDFEKRMFRRIFGIFKGES